MSRDAKQIWRSSLVTLAAAVFGAFPVVSSRAQAQSASLQTSPAAHASSQTAPAQRSRGQHKTFPSAEKAADALYTAAKDHDESGMLAILGSDAHDIVMWTDSSSDRNAQDDQFARKYEQMHRLVQEPDNETTLYVGAENWPLPLPIVEHDGAWYFDCSLGRREILYRRIGENEMETMETLRGIVDAENQHYANSAEMGANTEEYAQHFTCSEGQHDGLFSAASGSDDDSNAIGPYLAEASYERSDREPFHGYFFHILTAQGAHAHGGARNYIVDGKMTGGFAVVAFPAAYRSSGVKTFIVSQNGRIFSKDLGAKTTQLAAAMKTYDPDSTWARVRPNEFLNADVTP